VPCRVVSDSASKPQRIQTQGGGRACRPPVLFFDGFAETGLLELPTVQVTPGTSHCRAGLACCRSFSARPNSGRVVGWLGFPGNCTSIPSQCLLLTREAEPLRQGDVLRQAASRPLRRTLANMPPPRTASLASTVLLLALGVPLLIGGLIAAFHAPDFSHDSEATGVVTDVQMQRAWVHFRLSGANRRFAYNTKAGNVGQVVEALRASGPGFVTVRYSGESIVKPMLSTDEFYVVGEISSPYGSIATAEQIRDGYRRDNLVMLPIGALLSFVGFSQLLRRRRSTHVG